MMTETLQRIRDEAFRDACRVHGCVGGHSKSAGTTIPRAVRQHMGHYTQLGRKYFQDAANPTGSFRSAINAAVMSGYDQLGTIKSLRAAYQRALRSSPHLSKYRESQKVLRELEELIAATPGDPDLAARLAGAKAVNNALRGKLQNVELSSGGVKQPYRKLLDEAYADLGSSAESRSRFWNTAVPTVGAGIGVGAGAGVIGHYTGEQSGIQDSQKAMEDMPWKDRLQFAVSPKSVMNKPEEPTIEKKAMMAAVGKGLGHAFSGGKWLGGKAVSGFKGTFRAAGTGFQKLRSVREGFNTNQARFMEGYNQKMHNSIGADWSDQLAQARKNEARGAWGNGGMDEAALKAQQAASQKVLQAHDAARADIPFWHSNPGMTPGTTVGSGIGVGGAGLYGGGMIYGNTSMWDDSARAAGRGVSNFVSNTVPSAAGSTWNFAASRPSWMRSKIQQGADSAAGKIW